MSHASKSLAARDLARRMKEARQKVFNEVYIKEGILRCDIKLVPVDPSMVVPEIENFKKDTCYIKVNAATKKKILDEHNMSVQLLDIYDSKLLNIPKRSVIDIVMQPFTWILILQVYTETTGTAFGLVNYMHKHGFVETKKMLLEKYGSEEKKKQEAKNVNGKIDMVNKAAKELLRDALRVSGKE